MIFIIVFAILGILCLGYYCVLVSYAGFGTSFAVIWLLMTIVFFVLTVVFWYIHGHQIRIKPVLKYIFTSIFAAGMLFFCVVQGMIISGMVSHPSSNLDYLVVLGAQVRGTRITSPLAYRLDRAYDYLNQNPDTMVVVSGGQGTGEDISEAEAMESYLIDLGIDESRIIKEDQSTNTEENIANSMKLIQADWQEEEEPTYGVVTNNFHVFRAVAICHKMGYDVDGISAKLNPKILPNYMLREFFAIVKYKIDGTI